MNGGQAATDRPARPDRVRFRLTGISQPHDNRTCAIRGDLADVALAERYFAPHYAAAVPLRCTANSAVVRATPDLSASAVTELLYGEVFQVLDVRSGFAWGYCDHDHYVGYVEREALGAPGDATHVTLTRAPVFAGADIKAPVLKVLPARAHVAGTTQGPFLALDQGYVHHRHIAPITAIERDWASVATAYLGVPYVWGGRGGLGVDCSGLVQMALAACGKTCPRDTDQQALVVGDALADTDDLQRGDIIFFPGHVGMMMDERNLLHANANAMAVTIEPLSDVTERLSRDHDAPITGRRRITP